MKVLLFSNDLMPFGNLPTSGGGLRCWQLYQGLKAHGIEVVASMPDFTYLSEKFIDKIPPEVREVMWTHGSQDEVLHKVNPDAVIFSSNWDHCDLATELSVPLIIDLHGSRIIETIMWDSPVSTEKKVSTFAKADCMLSAGQRQRLYFNGWLVQAGRVPEDEHIIKYIPVSSSPDIPKHNYPDGSQGPRFVSGGGWFPWQNQSLAISKICEEIQSRSSGTIDIYGTPHSRIGNSPEELQIIKVYEKIKALSESNQGINTHGYIGRDELIEKYLNSSVAVEVMQYNLERELAFTTRTIEYLWCGLPVLYNDYAEISDHIRDYDAGWCVDPESESSIQEALEEIFSCPDVVKQKGENASRLAKDRFSWDKTIEPLVEFLNNPKKLPQVEPAFGTVYAKPAYLSARGQVTDLELGLEVTELQQDFVVPAEELGGIELPIRILSDEAAKSGASVDIRVLKKKSGRVMFKKRVPLSVLAEDGHVILEFPILRGPRGGDELVFHVRLLDLPRNKMPLVAVQGLCEPTFPFVLDENFSMTGKTVSGEVREAKALGFSFVPGQQSSIYRTKVLARRALNMIKNGEWKRVTRAVKKRLPAVSNQVKRKAGVILGVR